MKTIESDLQRACVTWFRLQYPHYRLRLFAIPNGGQRSISTAARLKAEGVTAGVWDLFLAVPIPHLTTHRNASGLTVSTIRMPYHGLFIEMKAPKGKLTESQVTFHSALDGDYAFAVCRSLEEFQTTIKEYLK